MSARAKRLDELGSKITWAEYPTLEALYNEMAGEGAGSAISEDSRSRASVDEGCNDSAESERNRRLYFDSIVDAAEKEQAKVLAIELSILDRSSSPDDKMTFRSCFYQLLDPAVIMATKYQGTGPAADGQFSPYETAMQYMTEHSPEGGDVPEPIVLHPGLRDNELLYIVSDPAKDDFAAPPAETRYCVKMLEPTAPILLRKARSTVEDQVSVFHKRFLHEVKKVAAFYHGSTKADRKSELFRRATLLVVPFIRDTSERTAREEVAGEGDRDIIEREGASGLVAFVWFVPNEPKHEPALADRIAARILELHRVLLIKDSIHKSTLLAQKSQFVQDAAHGIANQIATLQLRAVSGLFFEGRREGAPRIATFKMVEGRPDVIDRNIETIIQYDESVDFVNGLVSNYLAVIELGTGPGFIREKFQAESAYSIENCLEAALLAANQWRPNGPPLAAFDLVRKYQSAGAMANLASSEAFWLPRGYLRSGILQSQFIESIMNVRKHGARSSNGLVRIAVDLCFDTNRDRPLCVTMTNRAQTRLERASPKISPLNFVPGLKVASDVVSHADGDEYQVVYQFGPATYEIRKTGMKERAAPFAKISEGVDHG